jgi:hypothetical protein
VIRNGIERRDSVVGFVDGYANAMLLERVCIQPACGYRAVVGRNR